MIRLLLLAAMLVAGPALAAPQRKPVHRAAAAHAPAKADWTKTVADTPEGGMRLGNPVAAIKLVEYGSRTCPHCAHFSAEGLPQLVSKYVASGSVSYEFRDMPVHGALDIPPILIGHCVPPSRFFPLLAGMMANQDALLAKTNTLDQAKLQALNGKPGELFTTLADQLGYTAFAAKYGLTPVAAHACLADPKRLNAAVKVASDAESVVRSTPTFLINGTATDAATWEALEPKLVAAGAK